VAIAVIGGTAGVLYMKGRVGVVEPHVSSTTTGAPTAARPEMPGAGSAAVDLPAVETTTTEATTTETTTEATANADELAEKLRRFDDVRQRESQKLATEHPRPKGDGATAGLASGPGGGGGGGAGGEGDGEDRGLDYKQEGRDAAVVIAAEEPRGGQGTVGGVATHMGGTVTATESPPPEMTGATFDELETSKNVTSAPDTAGTRGDKPPPPTKREQAENLLEQARTAAKKKNCPTVKVMAKRAKQLDAAYYRDTFSRDAAVKDCL
jgi:hypothetical protein